MNPDQEYFLQICVIGSYDGFRTDFIYTFTGSKSQPNPVGGVDISTKRVVVDDKPVKLIVTNPNTAEFFGALRPSYYRGASACIIFFDKNNRQSFEDVPKWFEEFSTSIPSSPLALVGFLSDDDEISSDEGKAQAELLDMAYFECKPTDKEKITKIFKFLATKALEE